VAEFNIYFQRFDEVTLFSTSARFQHWIHEYGRHYPQLTKHVRPYDKNRTLRGKGAYLVFLQNAFRFVEQLEKEELPFVFELYPGGEFRLDEAVSDERLRRVFSSPMFRKVIATQMITRDYLVEKGFCDPAQIEFIFGGVLASNRLSDTPQPRRRYGIDKDVLDVCFVAYKHMSRGIDKGYDRFIATARMLADRNQQIRFHVVGSFDESDVDIGDLEGRISFYGSRYTDFFAEFYANMDIMLSPNVPFVLDPGAFDAFPTGGCVEAALCGVAIFCADELAMNNGILKDREEIVIVPIEPEKICAIVEEFVARPEILARLAIKGQQAFRSIFDLEKQMEPRLRVLSSLLEMDNAKDAATGSEKHDN